MRTEKGMKECGLGVCTFALVVLPASLDAEGPSSRWDDYVRFALQPSLWASTTRDQRMITAGGLSHSLFQWWGSRVEGRQARVFTSYLTPSVHHGGHILDTFHLDIFSRWLSLAAVASGLWSLSLPLSLWVPAFTLAP